MAFNMKNIIFAFAFFYSYSLSAQGNLQYNQTKFIKLSAATVSVGGGAFYGADSITITVPVGKTLKIESANVGMLSTGSGSISSFPDRAIYTILSLDNTMIGYAAGYGGANTEPNILFPVWLPTGNYKLKLNTIVSSVVQNYRINGFISAIEFNIVP